MSEEEVLEVVKLSDGTYVAVEDIDKLPDGVTIEGKYHLVPFEF